MNLKTYRAASIADALQQIKRDLGPDAVILHTRTFKRGGWLGIGGRTLVEITASTSVNVVHPLARKGKAPSEPIIRPGADFVRRAYGADANASPKPAAAALAADASLNEPPIDEFTSTATALLEPDAAEKPAEKFEPKPEPSRNPAAPEPPKIRTTTPAIREASRLAETVAVPGDAGVTLTLKDDLAAIKKMVGQMLQRSSGPAQPVMPDALFQQYLRMIESEVSTEIADRIVAAVRDELHAQELADETVVKQAVLRRLEDHIPVCADTARPGRMPDGRPLTIALVGPTGVGKT
ncbi:MAG: hypothetical protein VYC34_12780, partial [Planctomycetota bacterium]|nr:hypothetical protein [Planctomycetota bacterium]